MTTCAIAGLDFRAESPSLLECLSFPGVWLGFDGVTWRGWTVEAGWGHRTFSTRLEAAELVASILARTVRELNA